MNQDISDLKSKVSLSNYQMLELTHNNERLKYKVCDLNNKGAAFLQQSQFQKATVFLSQAERLLEYAASCGMPLNRSIIVQVLHNQAAAHLKVGSYEKAIGYVQAILFNFESTVEEQKVLSIEKLLQSLNQKKNMKGKISSNRKNQSSIKVYLDNKFMICHYKLQFAYLHLKNNNSRVTLSSLQQTIDHLRHALANTAKLFWINQKETNFPEIFSFVSTPTEVESYQQESKYESIRAKVTQNYQKKHQKLMSLSSILKRYSSLQEGHTLNQAYSKLDTSQLVSIEPKFFSLNILYQKTQNTQQHLHDKSFFMEKLLHLAAGFWVISCQLYQHPEYKKYFRQQPFRQLTQYKSNSEGKEHSLEQAYHMISLHICINLVEQLTPFATQCWEDFKQKYCGTIFTEKQSQIKLQSLKEKYKSYIPELTEYVETPKSTFESPHQHNIVQTSNYYNTSSQDYQLDYAPISNKEASRKLQNLFKQKLQRNMPPNKKGTQTPPKLLVDQSRSFQMASIEIQNKQSTSTVSKTKQQVFEEKNQEVKMPKKISNLKPKSLKIMSNLSDISKKSNECITTENISSPKLKSERRKFKNKAKGLKSLKSTQKLDLNNLFKKEGKIITNKKCKQKQKDSNSLSQSKDFNQFLSPVQFKKNKLNGVKSLKNLIQVKSQDKLGIDSYRKSKSKSKSKRKRKSTKKALKNIKNIPAAKQKNKQAEQSTKFFNEFSKQDTEYYKSKTKKLQNQTKNLTKRQNDYKSPGKATFNKLKKSSSSIIGKDEVRSIAKKSIYIKHRLSKQKSPLHYIKYQPNESQRICDASSRNKIKSKSKSHRTIPGIFDETYTKRESDVRSPTMKAFKMYLSAIETENALRRSRIEAELALSRAATAEALRRSRVQAEVNAERQYREEALRRSRVEADLSSEQAALRRSRLQDDIKASNVTREEALRRSRLQAQVSAEQAEKAAAEKRARVQAEIAAEKAARQQADRQAELEAQIALERSQKEGQQRQNQLEAELEAQRLAKQQAVRNAQIATELAVKRAEEEQILRRSRIEAELAAERAAREDALRRSRIEAELAAERIARQEALRRSRIEAEVEASRRIRESALRRSRIEAEIYAQSALRRSRVEAELEASRYRRLYLY